MMGLPLFPIFIVDFFGSALMIILSITASFHARRLVRLNPKNVLWTYLFWLCMALVAFALSRSIGHMLRFIFILLDFPHVWETLSPYSGGLNTLVFSSVAVLTFYYYNVQGVIQRVRDDANSLARANRQLEKVHAELRDLNTTLEQRVENRTRELKVSEQKFRHLYEGSKDMIFFCDAAGRISGINSSGIEMLGY
ncbi:MAG TPA: PAS domain-containing sensor histidine kinase, partial [Desulfobacteraceae bacterium]|nr:PAS domain-containing sensor histidine kinase [Desulfobacteraceae bacterium]